MTTRDVRLAIWAVVAPLTLVAATVLLLLPVLFFEPQGASRGYSSDAKHLRPDEKLAMSVAISAGILAPVPGGMREGSPWAPRWDFLGEGLNRCAPNHLTRAIVATEMYVRPSWIQKLELALADSLYALVGGYPDWSLGPAQIKISTATNMLRRRIARTREAWGLRLDLPKAPATVDLLRDECTAVQVAGMIVDDHARQIGTRDPGSLANAYRGGYERLIGRFGYPDVVTSLARPGLFLDALHTLGTSTLDSDPLSYRLREFEDADWAGGLADLPSPSATIHDTGMMVELVACVGGMEPRQNDLFLANSARQLVAAVDEPVELDGETNARSSLASIYNQLDPAAHALLLLVPVDMVGSEMSLLRLLKLLDASLEERTALGLSDLPARVEILDHAALSFTQPYCGWNWPSQDRALILAIAAT